MSTTEPTPALTPDQIRAQIERTRADLAETVDALAAKADVKGQAKDKVHEVTDTVKEKATDLAGTVKEKATDLAGTVKDKAAELKGRAADAVPHAGHPDHGATPGVPMSGEDTVVITDTGISSDTGIVGNSGIVGDSGLGATGSKHRAPVEAELGPLGTADHPGNSGDDAPGAVAQAKDKVSAVAGSVAAAASGAAADVRAKVAGATGHGGADPAAPGEHAVAPAQRSTATTAGAVAAVLAVLAVVVIVRKRRAADA